MSAPWRSMPRPHRHLSTCFDMFRHVSFLCLLCLNAVVNRFSNDTAVSAVWLWEFKFSQTGHAAGVHTVPIAWFDTQVVRRLRRLRRLRRFVGYDVGDVQACFDKCLTLLRPFQRQGVFSLLESASSARSAALKDCEARCR